MHYIVSVLVKNDSTEQVAGAGACVRSSSHMSNWEQRELAGAKLIARTLKEVL